MGKRITIVVLLLAIISGALFTLRQSKPVAADPAIVATPSPTATPPDEVQTPTSTPYMTEIPSQVDPKMPQLLVLEPTDSGCILKVTKNGGFQNWVKLKSCPSKENLIFDSSRNRVLILQDGKYWTAEKKLGVEPKVLIDAFPAPYGDGDSKTWIDEKTKRLSTSWLIPYGALQEASDEGLLKKNFPLLQDTWIRTHEGLNGEPSVALVAQLDEAGRWQILVEQKSDCCSDAASGLKPVRDFIHEDKGVLSLQDLLLKMTCYERPCDSSKLKPSQEVVEWISKTFKHDSSSSTGYIPMGPNDGFIFQTFLGDIDSAIEPVYYCKNDCLEHVLIESPTGLKQEAFAQKAEFMIVSQEYDGEYPKVWQTGSSKPFMIFGADSVALWLPDDFQF